MTQPTPASALDEAPVRRPRLVVAGIAIAYAAAYLLWLRVGGGSDRVRELASEAVFLPLNATLTIVFLLAAGRDDTRPPMQRALRDSQHLRTTADLISRCFRGASSTQTPH